MRTSDVFGVNTHINEYSYVDRGNLDHEISRLAHRNQHISLKGESKSGKSWLRQKNFAGAVVVQCRLGFSALDVFVSILAALDISLRMTTTTSGGAGFEISGNGELGWELLARAEAAASASGKFERSVEKKPVGKDANDLHFLCEILKASERKVVIEDFHYLTTEAQRQLAHDLKAMWDFGIYVVIVGVWVRRNYLTHLNPDLAGRISEVSVYWNTEDLRAVLRKGCRELRVEMSREVESRIVQDSFGNVGLLQTLALETLDQSGITEKGFFSQKCSSTQSYETAALLYAEQLEAVYLEFARRVSNGIRQRKGSTKIYAHAMWAIFDSTDDELLQGVSVDKVFERAAERQPRVQKGNLRSILRKLDILQIDDRGKGLVVTFVEQSNSVAVVDRSVLFYRKYCTVEWPWKEIVDEGEEDELAVDAD